MHQPPSSYRDAGKILRADTCRPLVAAMRSGSVRLEALARGAYPGIPLPARVLPNLRTVGFWDAALPQGWGLDWHCNEGIELTYLESGSLSFSVDDKRFALEPGDLTITRPWQMHRVGMPHVTPGRLYWVILDVGVRRPREPWRWPRWITLNPDDLRALTALLRAGDIPVWPGTREVESCFQQIGRLVVEGQSSRTLYSRLSLLINELLIVLLETLGERAPIRARTRSPSEEATHRFLKRLPAALDEPWTLEGMAEAAGLGRTRFAHYCRKLTNQTPAEYLIHLRLQKSRALMRRNPKRSLTDIALECGFGSGQYFATLFRKDFGITPTQFRLES